MEPIGLQHIETIYFPKELVEDVYQQIRETGANGYERLALCAGKKQGKEFMITHVLYPEQYLRKTILGVSFHVYGTELESIGDWLYENQLSLIAQIHSHPDEAYHSEADDKYAIITKAGGVSIVIPHFGTKDSYFDNSAFYRLHPNNEWQELSKEQIIYLFKLTE